MRLQDVSLPVKVFLAPALMLAALLGLTVYTSVLLAHDEQRINALSGGAFRRTVMVAGLGQEVGAVHAELYRLCSVGANDADADKAQAIATALGQQVAGLDQQYAAVAQAIGPDPTLRPLIQGIGKTLKDYADSAQQVVGMAGNAGYALIFMSSAQQAYERVLRPAGAVEPRRGGGKDQPGCRRAGRDTPGPAGIRRGCARLGGGGDRGDLLLGRWIARPIVAMAGVDAPAGRRSAGYRQSRPPTARMKWARWRRRCWCSARTRRRRAVTGGGDDGRMP